MPSRDRKTLATIFPAVREAPWRPVRKILKRLAAGRAAAPQRLPVRTCRANSNRPANTPAGAHSQEESWKRRERASGRAAARPYSIIVRGNWRRAGRGERESIVRQGRPTCFALHKLQKCAGRLFIFRGFQNDRGLL